MNSRCHLDFLSSLKNATFALEFKLFSIFIIYQTKENNRLHILNDLDVKNYTNSLNDITFKFYVKGDDNFTSVVKEMITLSSQSACCGSLADLFLNDAISLTTHSKNARKLANRNACSDMGLNRRFAPNRAFVYKVLYTQDVENYEVRVLFSLKE